MLLYDTGISPGVSLDKHVGARMSGIFQARAMRGVLEPYLVHPCPMPDYTTKRDIYQITVVRVGGPSEYGEMETIGLGVITCKSAIYVPART